MVRAVPGEVADRITVTAAPAAVYDAVSDVRRMARRSVSRSGRGAVRRAANDRPAINRAGIRTTLERLKRELERA